jgi:hypothetical protein
MGNKQSNKELSFSGLGANGGKENNLQELQKLKKELKMQHKKQKEEVQILSQKDGKVMEALHRRKGLLSEATKAHVNQHALRLPTQ